MKKHKIGSHMLNDIADKQWNRFMEKKGIFQLFETWYNKIFAVRLQENLNKSLNHYEEEI